MLLGWVDANLAQEALESEFNELLGLARSTCSSAFTPILPVRLSLRDGGGPNISLSDCTGPEIPVPGSLVAEAAGPPPAEVFFEPTEIAAEKVVGVVQNQDVLDHVKEERSAQLEFLRCSKDRRQARLKTLEPAVRQPLSHNQ